MLDKTQTIREVQIPAPRFSTAEFKLIGTAPYMQARFAKKAGDMMREKMMSGSQAKKGKKREARDFDDDYKQAMHISREGWCGIPASGFRLAMISACRLVGFRMTLAKLTLFVEQDGFDHLCGTPLIKIMGEPQKDERLVRNATGVADIRARPRWDDWSAMLRIRFDDDQFSLADVSNLLTRVGMQVGIGEGRPDSKDSAGLGFGLFRIESPQ
jgi:hypothetical protein